MPKVRRRNLPVALYEHLLERVQQRNITGKELTSFIKWLDPRYLTGNGSKGFRE
jgi:hypothetical protein